MGGGGNSAVCNLNSGLMVAAAEYIGSDNGTPVFTQTGGTNSITNGGLYLGWVATTLDTCLGTYDLGGVGSLSVTGTAVIGDNAAGIFTQTGGTCTLPTLSLAYSAGSSGAYNLNGGLLNLTGLVAGSGTAAFNFGGGTLQAGASFSTTVPMTLTGSGGNAAVDTAGHTLTLSGSLSGPGGLTKTDAGALILAGSEYLQRRHGGRRWHAGGR